MRAAASNHHRVAMKPRDLIVLAIIGALVLAVVRYALTGGTF